MSELKLSLCVTLAMVSICGYGQDPPDPGKRAEPGGRPSETQVSSWRARRAARGEKPAAAETPATPATPATEACCEGGAEPAAASHDNATAGRAAEGDRAGRPTGVALETRSAGVLWLSESPPSRGDGARGGRPSTGGMAGMGGMARRGERGGPPRKRLWLRSGTDPQKSAFAHDDAAAPPEGFLVTPQGKPEGEPLPRAEDGRLDLAFAMPTQGYYRLYVTTGRVQAGTLTLSAAKAEVANFSHGGAEEERVRALAVTRLLESAPIEVVREKLPNEPAIFQLTSGDEQPFIVLQKGLPLQGARVRFVSHQGWSKEAVSDEQGRVSFQVIRDYYPPWSQFQKRLKSTYLVIAEAVAEEAGQYHGQPYERVRYQATLAGSYCPSRDDYRSSAWGLGVGLLAVLSSGSAVYLYRRRRLQPFQEVRFDDAA